MALLRRLEKRILVTLPTPEARTQMMVANLPKRMVDERFPYAEFAEHLEVSHFPALLIAFLRRATLAVTSGLSAKRRP